MNPAPAGAGSARDELRRAAAFCFVEDLEDPTLAAQDLHHLADVLRLAPGERVALGDGAGRYRLATVVTPAGRAPGGRRGGGQRLALAPEDPIHAEPAAREPVTVAFGLQKGERGEWAVQKLTEIGVEVIVPLLTERTVVRLDDRDAARRGARLARIAREAAAQSRRTHVPKVSAPVEFAAYARCAPLVLAEPGGRAPRPDDRELAIGPEGGWSEGELARASDLVDLGPTVLRAETAALVAATVLVRGRAEPETAGRGARPDTGPRARR